MSEPFDKNSLDDAEPVRILPPDFAIKRKIGMDVNIRDIFTPERIAAAQQSIDENQAKFIEWVQKDLVDLEHAYRTIDQNPGDPNALRMDKIRTVSFSIKCQAGTFGYDLGSEVAKSLYDYATKHPQFSQDSITVLRKHIDALQVIFQQNIQGDGDQIGAELMDTLVKLVEKFN